MRGVVAGLFVSMVVLLARTSREVQTAHSRLDSMQTAYLVREEAFRELHFALSQSRIEFEQAVTMEQAYDAGISFGAFLERWMYETTNNTDHWDTLRNEKGVE